jgi:hypothetical protein
MNAQFLNYLEDCLNLHVGLMSQGEIDAAYQGWLNMQKKQPAKSVHPDSKKPLAELIARCERLTHSQQISVEKFENVAGYEAAVIAGRMSVAEGRRLLAAKRATKNELIAHAEMNANASRAFNAAKNAQ